MKELDQGEQNQKDKQILETGGFNQVKKEIENLPSGKAFLQIFREYADGEKFTVINGWRVNCDSKLFLAALKEDLPNCSLGIIVDDIDLNLVVFSQSFDFIKRDGFGKDYLYTKVKFDNHSDSDDIEVNLEEFTLPNKDNEWVLNFCKRASQIISEVNLKK